MNKYTLYIGANNETGAVETEQAQEVLDMNFTGYNILKSNGVWNGKHEQGINVTIYTDYTMEKITEIVKKLCGVLKQQCIIVGYVIDCGVEFIERDELCSIVGCNNVVIKDGGERYLDGQVVCNSHASKIDGY